MTDEQSQLIRDEIRAARRLALLFRAERVGRFGRRSGETVRRLIDRRSRLIDELRGMDLRRRSVTPPAPPELAQAMGDLAFEIDHSEQSCHALLARLGDELRRLRGAGGPPTGLRDGPGGRLLGSG